MQHNHQQPFSKQFFSVLVLGLLLTLFASGCASVSVGNITAKGTPPKKLPSKIYVREFSAPIENFRVDRSKNDLEAFIKNERKALAQNLVQQLSKYLAPAEILPEDEKMPRGNYWLVKGEYKRANQGSRLLRALIGFGAGGTKLETSVRVMNLSVKPPTPFLTLMSTGGSGMAPGAVGAFSPAAPLFVTGAVVNASGASLSGLSIDRNRTAREITATLSEYCFLNHLITERRTRRPKKLGLLPPFQRPDFFIPKKGL
ncbi:MAG: DUF4410 domain-containing protein [Verrucomicrobiota bacterium]